jgi:hypothetical protein
MVSSQSEMGESNGTQTVSLWRSRCGDEGGWRTRSRDARLVVTWTTGLRLSNGKRAVTCWFGLVVSCCVLTRLDV